MTASDGLTSRARALRAAVGRLVRRVAVGKEIRITLREDTLRLSRPPRTPMPSRFELSLARAQLSLLERFLPAQPVFVDIGSGHGAWALTAGLLRPQATIRATEPHPRNLAILRANAVNNSVANCHAILAAAGDRCSDDARVAGPANGALIGTLFPPRDEKRELRVVQTPTRTLDGLLREWQLDRVDLVKVTAGGAELQSLLGGRLTLQREDAPAIIFGCSMTETARFSQHPVELMWLLQGLGYALASVDPFSGAVGVDRPPGDLEGVFVALKAAHPGYADTRGGSR